MATPELMRSASGTFNSRCSLGDARRQIGEPVAIMPQGNERVYARGRGAVASNTSAHLNDTRSISIWIHRRHRQDVRAKPDETTPVLPASNAPYSFLIFRTPRQTGLSQAPYQL